jgi:macrolide-specific efflux system membrane fusion protein
MKMTLSTRLIAIKNWLLGLPLLGKIVVLAVVAGVLWFGYTKLRGSSTAAPQYQTATVTRGTLVVSVTASGQVSTANSGSISTNASGVVTKVFVKNGDVVKGGAPIAEMELDQNGQQKYDQALSSYQGAKNNLQQAQADLYSLQSKMFAANQSFMNGAVANGLAQGDTVYIQQNGDWLAAEAAYQNQQNVITAAQSSVNSAAASLQQASPTVYAPISGTVTGMSLQVGSVLTAQSSTTGTPTSQKIASIQTSAPPTITVNMTEIDIPKVKIGDRATLTFDALPNKPYTGKVVSIDTIGTVSSGVTTYPVVIGLDITAPDIYSNMNAQANIITDTRDNVLSVPSAAVQTSSTGATTVRVLNNGQITSVPVQVGISSDTDTEITSGLNEGDTVVTSVINPTTTTSTTGTTSVFSALGGGRGGFGGGGGGGGAVRVGGGGGAARGN